MARGDNPVYVVFRSSIDKGSSVKDSNFTSLVGTIAKHAQDDLRTNLGNENIMCESVECQPNGDIVVCADGFDRAYDATMLESRLMECFSKCKEFDPSLEMTSMRKGYYDFPDGKQTNVDFYDFANERKFTTQEAFARYKEGMSSEKIKTLRDKYTLSHPNDKSNFCANVQLQMIDFAWDKGESRAKFFEELHRSGFEGNIKQSIADELGLSDEAISDMKIALTNRLSCEDGGRNRTTFGVVISGLPVDANNAENKKSALHVLERSIEDAMKPVLNSTHVFDKYTTYAQHSRPFFGHVLTQEVPESFATKALKQHEQTMHDGFKAMSAEPVYDNVQLNQSLLNENSRSMSHEGFGA